MDHALGVGAPWRRIASAAIGLIGTAALAWALYATREATLAGRHLAQDAERLRARATSATPAPSRSEMPLESLRRMNTVIAHLNVPWADVLDAIERNTSRRVALLALEPEAVAGTVTLTVEARTLEDLLEYANALSLDAAVAAVRLAQHEVQTQEASLPVRMTFSVSLAPLRR